MNDRGQTTLEYILVAVLIAVAIILAFRSAAIDNAVHDAGVNVQDSLVVTE